VHKEFRFVIKVAKFVALALIATCVMAAPVMAQGADAAAAGSPGATAAPAGGWISFSGAFGVGLTVIGAAYGIGRLAGAALESMARQPEVAGNIQTAMIIAAALIEGFTFYALYICSTQNPWG
jgi:F-type H+-transporting ATPase subunit c